MATIDLIVLGILKKEPMSAYDIQKLVEYRNISKWVKISTPSIYKKAIQLEEKGLIQGEIVKEGKMPEKAIYSLTEAGEAEFERLMFEIAAKPINIFLDFNAVIVNLESLPAEKQKSCIAEIEENVSILKSYLEDNIREKENEPSIPATGMAVLRQQYVLAEAIQTWVSSLNIV
ncbi:PadR family transcriptional regulator [Oscillibacter valericigenes]|nr:PadR family transcriptional regulator [Oscillibacter valericigenes]